MLTISQVARRFGLSRSTLLYYDSIGLLRPSSRSASGYRLYSADDVARMDRIDLYRRAGLSLADIGRVLDTHPRGLDQVLEARLRALDSEIDNLRRQQQMIAGLLGPGTLGRKRKLDKAGWVAILRATGLNDDDMRRWHIEFERLSPDGHREFLESLGIDAKEISRIRRFSREASGDGGG